MRTRPSVPRRPLGRRAQVGMTLIETTIGIFVLGSVLVAGFTGLMFSIRQTDRIGIQTRTELALSDFSEGIKQIPYRRAFRTGAAYGCAADTNLALLSAVDKDRGSTISSAETLPAVYTTAFQSWLTANAVTGANAAAAGYFTGTGAISGLTVTSFTVTNVEFWNAVNNSWDPEIRCHDASIEPKYADQGIQKVTLRVKWGTETKSIDVIKTKRAQ